jgi:hypothetical protein
MSTSKVFRWVRAEAPQRGGVPRGGVLGRGKLESGDFQGGGDKFAGDFLSRADFSKFVASFEVPYPRACSEKTRL